LEDDSYEQRNNQDILRYGDDMNYQELRVLDYDDEGG